MEPEERAARGERVEAAQTVLAVPVSNVTNPSLFTVLPAVSTATDRPKLVPKKVMYVIWEPVGSSLSTNVCSNPVRKLCGPFRVAGKLDAFVAPTM